jgi:RNA polymerase sigma-70 factor, ECF subfamily
MGGQTPTARDDRSLFLAFYDDALPHVYAYFSARCEGRALAEDLTAETFLAAVDAARRDDPPPPSRSWIIGVARHKLVDHWRRQAREERRFQLLTEVTAQVAEPWPAELDAMSVRRAFGELAPQHRAALTLRYLDDLAVPEVAALLGRSVGATEALLVRARAAFRRCYADEETPGA